MHLSRERRKDRSRQRGHADHSGLQHLASRDTRRTWDERAGPHATARGQSRHPVRLAPGTKLTGPPARGEPGARSSDSDPPYSSERPRRDLSRAGAAPLTDRIARATRWRRRKGTDHDLLTPDSACSAARTLCSAASSGSETASPSRPLASHHSSLPIALLIAVFSLWKASTRKTRSRWSRATVFAGDQIIRPASVLRHSRAASRSAPSGMRETAIPRRILSSISERVNLRLHIAPARGLPGWMVSQTDRAFFRAVPGGLAPNPGMSALAA